LSPPWIANRAESWVQGNPVPEGAVLISITDPGREAALPLGYEEVLRLQFHDCDPEAQTLGPEAMLFQPEQAERIWLFTRRHRGRNVVVHCAAGISRSRAVVEALLRAFPEYEDRGDESHSPNGHVLRSLLAPVGSETRDGLDPADGAI
jgi:predicted protein tyrosine phosphatase